MRMRMLQAYYTQLYRFPWHKSMALLPVLVPISHSHFGGVVKRRIWDVTALLLPSPCPELEIEFLADFRNPLLDYLQILRRTVLSECPQRLAPSSY